MKKDGVFEKGRAFLKKDGFFEKGRVFKKRTGFLKKDGLLKKGRVFYLCRVRDTTREDHAWIFLAQIPRNSCGHSWLRGCRVDFVYHTWSITTLLLWTVKSVWLATTCVDLED